MNFNNNKLSVNKDAFLVLYNIDAYTSEMYCGLRRLITGDMFCFEQGIKCKTCFTNNKYVMRKMR